MSLRRQRFASERLLVLAGLGVASTLAVALELARELVYGADDYRFLLWNLVLAWMPLLLALVLYDGYRRRPRTSAAGLLAVGSAWLLFLPNAPYIVTDFVHLAPVGPPLWLDGVMVSAFAWTGLILGFVSLHLVHAVVRHHAGARAGWVFATVVLALVSVGICLGRVLRWNSWDVVSRPGELASQLLQHTAEPASVARAIALVTLLTLGLAAAYLSYYAIVGARLEAGRRRTD